MWKKLMKNNDLDEPTSFLDHVYWRWTQRECKPNEIIFEEYTKDVWITYFCWSNRKITRMGRTSRKNGCVVLRYGKTCLKVRWEIFRIVEQKDTAVIQSLKSLLGRSPFQKRNWNQLENNRLVPGTNRSTWYSVVSRQTCPVSHRMDTSMWQTIGHINTIHSSYKWLPTLLPCG